MDRCSWVSDDPLYQEYHDYEWGKPVYDDQKLYEMFLLETFQAGLSWITILHKREAFKEAFDDFDVFKVAYYDEKKVNELMNWSYTNHKIIYLEDEELATTSPLSDKISKDLKKRGMSFVGSITIYSYLEAIGIYNHHQRNCFLHP